MSFPHVGTRVQTRRIIDRELLFTLEKIGAKGTVTFIEENFIAIKMDEFIPECEEWDNEIQLTSHEFGDYGQNIFIGSMEELFNFYFELEGSQW